MRLISQVPYPVFFLRYSLFFVLYPTGITGELLQMWTYMPSLVQTNLYDIHVDLVPICLPVRPLWYLLFVILVLYVPGSPFMYMHMVAQRASAFSARNRPAPKPNGVEFPVTDKVTGERGTTETNKGCFAAAVDGIDNAEKKRILDEKNWRFKYD